MTYEYLCPVHGELTIEHRMSESRKGRSCTRDVARRPGKKIKRICGAPLKPLISSDTHHRDHPAIFRGGGWEYKEQAQYREYHVRSDPKTDPFGHQAAKERRQRNPFS